MSYLFFDKTVRKIIENLKKYAWDNRITLSDLKKMIIKGELKPIGSNPDNNLIIGNHRIVYSVEEQPFGWCRHMSISVLKPDDVTALPSIPAVLELMKEFGFEHKELGKRSNFFNYWIEDVSEDEQAVNIIEKIRE